VVVLGDDLRRGGAEQVTGAPVAQPDPGKEIVRRLGLQRLEELERLPGVGAVEQRPGLAVPAVALLPGVASLLFLQLAGVLEHQPGERARRLRRPDGAAEAPAHQLRDQADVIEVGVGEDDAVDGGGLEREPAPVARLGLLVALEHPAVDEQPALAEVEQRRAAGHGAARADEGDFGQGSGVSGESVAKALGAAGGLRYHRWDAPRRGDERTETMSDEKLMERAKGVVGDAAEGMKEVVKDGLDEARERFEEATDDLEKRARRTRRELRRRAEEAGDAAKEKVEHVREQARERYDKARDGLQKGYEKVRKDAGDLVEDVNAYVRQNPGKAVLFAAGAGFLIGLLSRGRRREEI